MSWNDDEVDRRKRNMHTILQMEAVLMISAAGSGGGLPPGTLTVDDEGNAVYYVDDEHQVIYSTQDPE